MRNRSSWLKAKGAAAACCTPAVGVANPKEVSSTIADAGTRTTGGLREEALSTGDEAFEDRTHLLTAVLQQ